MQNKPDILVFIDWYYPGFRAGGPVRSCLNMVEHLNDDFNFHIVTGNTEYTETEPYPNLTFDKWVDGPFLEKVQYLTPEKRTVKNYMEIIGSKKFQAVMIMGIFSNSFSILPLKAANKANFSKIIVSPRGMLAPGALRIKSMKKKFFLAWANFSGFYRNVIFHVSNPNESNQVKKKIRKFREIIIADNFPRSLHEIPVSSHKKEPGKLKVVSVARIAPEKNTLFALEALSACKRQIEFDLFGSVYDEEYWKKCNSLIEKMPLNVKVRFKGGLASDQLVKTLSEYDVMFLPTLGENFGHIILESFMCGVPVLISDQTPWRNLELMHLGFDLKLEMSSAFSNKLDEMADWNPEELNTWKRAAFEFGKRKADTSELRRDYIKLLQ